MLNNLVIEFSAVQDTILRNEAAEAFMHTCTENCGLAAGFPAYFNLAYHLCLLLFYYLLNCQFKCNVMILPVYKYELYKNDIDKICNNELVMIFGEALSCGSCSFTHV